MPTIENSLASAFSHATIFWIAVALEGGMRQVLLIVLILALVGALPMWPYSTGWGYYPSGGTGLLVLIVLVLLLTGRL
jgi:hypothetical protein